MPHFLMLSSYLTLQLALTLVCLDNVGSLDSRLERLPRLPSLAPFVKANTSVTL